MRGRTFGTRDEARGAVFAYIEGWYNPHRRHSALGYESLVSYEREFQTAGNNTFQEAEVVGVGVGEEQDHGTQG